MDRNDFIRKARCIAQEAEDLMNQIQSASCDRKEDSYPIFRLAHYTTLEALVSMLQAQNGGLRLSDSSTMNDPDEGIATKDGRSIKQFLESEFRHDSWLRRRYENAHICCFVGVERGAAGGLEPGDDLLFWRLYGNDCRGLSITLSPESSTRLLQQNVVHEIIYSSDAPLTVDMRPLSRILNDLEQLRLGAIHANQWESIFSSVIPKCDLLMAYRFLHKNAHYSMEREYRTIAFVGEDHCAPEDKHFVDRGQHVQYNRIRTYVQLAELVCRELLVTNSRITIGSNVPESEQVKCDITHLLSKSLKLAPNVVKVRESSERYRV